ncbi:MAG: hypothetical protein DYG99_06115 [Bacteroidetes bacterium CHB5]|nr:hypothetical protein [Bacteroidetes bacterium CHB5]
MLNRIARKMSFQILKSKILPYPKLEEQFLLTPTEIDRASKILKPYYDYYIAHVSKADMAMSLELAALVYALCVKKELKNLLDLGSGFSSFVYRLYASTHSGVRVVSVDDDAQWLEKTRMYLHEQNLSDTRLITLEQFLEEPISGFDCVLHDLNFVEVRINYLPQVLAATAHAGVLILDDVHKPDYLHQVLKKLKHESVTVYNLKPATLDSFNRFALAVLKD